MFYNKSNRSYRYTLIALLLLSAFLLTGNVFAQATSTATFDLEKARYPWKGAETPGGLVKEIYIYALGVVGVVALGVLIYGGILWTVSGAVSTKQDALEWIKGALWGLALLLGAYLILRTIGIISPKGELPKISINNTSAKNNTSANANANTNLTYVPGIGLVDIYSHTKASDIVYNNGIAITSSGNCYDPNLGSCTSLEGIPKSTIETLVNLTNDFRVGCSMCDVTITGGTETGHKEHGAGLPVLDLRYSEALAKFLNENQSKYGIKKIIKSPHGTGPHIHIVFSS